MIEKEIHELLIGVKFLRTHLAPLDLPFEADILTQLPKFLRQGFLQPARQPQTANSQIAIQCRMVVAAFVTIYHIFHIRTPILSCGPERHQPSAFLRFGKDISVDRAWASRQKRWSRPAPSSTRNRFRASPRPAGEQDHALVDAVDDGCVRLTGGQASCRTFEQSLPAESADGLSGKCREVFSEICPLENSFRPLVNGWRAASTHLIQMDGELRPIKRFAFAQILARGDNFIPGFILIGLKAEWQHHARFEFLLTL